MKILVEGELIIDALPDMKALLDIDPLCRTSWRQLMRSKLPWMGRIRLLYDRIPIQVPMPIHLYTELSALEMPPATLLPEYLRQS